MDNICGNSINNFDNIFIEKSLKRKIEVDEKDTEFLINKIKRLISGDDVDVYKESPLTYNFTKPTSYGITKKIVEHIDSINANSKKVKVFIVKKNGNYSDNYFCFTLPPKSDSSILADIESYKIVGWYSRLERDRLILKLLAK